MGRSQLEIATISHRTDYTSCVRFTFTAGFSPADTEIFPPRSLSDYYSSEQQEGSLVPTVGWNTTTHFTLPSAYQPVWQC